MSNLLFTVEIDNKKMLHISQFYCVQVRTANRNRIYNKERRKEDDQKFQLYIQYLDMEKI